MRTLFTLILLLAAAPAAATDWLQFRGTEQTGVAVGTHPPLHWDSSEGTNIAWETKLPGRGPSGPIVVAGQVIVTASSGFHQDRLHVLAFDASTGETLWHRQFWGTGRTQTNPATANAAPTPASDGRAIYAFYSSNDLICLELDGSLRWYRGLAHDRPKAGNDVGMASSPVVIDDTVVVQVENQGDSFAAGIDSATGVTRWRVARPRRAQWSSPTVLRGADGSAVVLLQATNGVAAHDPKTGDQVWSFEAACSSMTSPLVNGGDVFLAAGGITRLSLDAPSATPNVTWESGRLQAGPATPIAHEGKVYVLNRGGVLVCGDVENGERLWQARLSGTFWASPVLAGNHLYCLNDKGQALVVDLAEEGKLVATIEMDDTFQASPCVADGALYIRSDRKLWKIAAP